MNNLIYLLLSIELRGIKTVTVDCAMSDTVILLSYYYSYYYRVR